MTIFFILISSIANSQSMYLSSEIDTSTANIGDIITWKIIANNSSKENVVFPELKLNSDSIFVRSQRIIFTDKDDQGRIIEIAFWDTGRFYTPPYQISILNNQGDVDYNLEAEKLAIDIVSVITPSMNAVAKPVKGPVKVIGILPYRQIMLTVLGIIILIGIFWVWNKRIKNIYQKPIYSLTKTPSNIAKDRLAIINEKGFAKEFYTELSHITREFVENTTYIRTLEMTTEEIIQNKELFLFEVENFDDWITLLSKADMVKYAKQPVDNSEMIVDKHKAIHFIDNVLE